MGTEPRHRAPEIREKAVAVAGDYVRTRSLRQYGYAVIAVALACAAIFGGLRSVRTERAPLVKGAEIAAAPFTITIDRSSWTTDLGTAGKTDRGRFVLVVGTLRNTTDSTIEFGPIDAAVRIEGLTGIFQEPYSDATGLSENARPYGVFILADSSPLTFAGPGVAYQVAWIFEQSSAAPPPQSVTVVVRGHSLEVNDIDQVKHWTDAKVLAGGQFPVKQAGS